MRVRSTPPADYVGCPVTVEEALARGAVLRPPRWGILDAVIAILGAIVLSVAFAIGVSLLGLPIALVLITGLTVPWLAMIGWPALATALRGNGPIVDLGVRLRGSDFGWGVVAGLVAIFAGGAVAVVTTLIFGDFTSAAGEVAEELRSHGTVFLLAFAILVVVGAPIAEEVAFRGMLFASLMKRGVPPEWVIVITALMFSLIHLEPVRIPLLFTIGLVLGYIRWKTRSLGAPIVAHALNNLPGAVGLLVGFG